jgi:pimeloyl-ACP methyl ester carboxylesterase
MMIGKTLAASVLALFLLRPAFDLEAPGSATDEFLRPHQMIEVAKGRRLNLFCMGSGATTVLLDAGGSDWSVVWALVQPELAKTMRACSYDRAGLGYSDPAPGPRSPAVIVEDMHALIHAAKLDRNLVLVGHSLGGFHVKLYAALYPQDVAGLVLVDPSEERAWDRTRGLIEARFGETNAARAELLDQDFLVALVRHFQDCRDAARTTILAPTSQTYGRCSDPPRKILGDAVAAERQRLQVTTAYQTAQASEIEFSVYGSRAGDPIYAKLLKPGAFGLMPLILLTHAIEPPSDILDQIDATQTKELQRQTAALSRKGESRVLAGVGHHIELEAPQEIARAVASVTASSARINRRKPRPRDPAALGST